MSAIGVTASLLLKGATHSPTRVPRSGTWRVLSGRGPVDVGVRVARAEGEEPVLLRKLAADRLVQVAAGGADGACGD